MDDLVQSYSNVIKNMFTKKLRKIISVVSCILLLLFLYNLFLYNSLGDEIYESKKEKIGEKMFLVFENLTKPLNNPGDGQVENSGFIPSPSVDCTSWPQSSYLFCKSGADPMKRAMDLVSRLTTVELIGQTSSIAPAITRLGIKDYNWRSNCLHGWSSSMGNWGNLEWTVFPAPIGLAATFDPELVRLVGAITGIEGRALHNELLVRFSGSSTEAAGLNCFSPNVNLFRDPRWGRGQETFGEDPFLISVIGAGYTRGLQEGPDKNFLLVAACAKHFAVHSGPENLRLHFVANVSMYDMYYSYLPAFKSQVMGAKVAQMMPAYSGLRCTKQLDGAPDVANSFLLKSILRDQFGAPNISICSDNGALEFMFTDQHYVNSYSLAAAVSMNAGNDLDLGYDLVNTNHLDIALLQGLVTLDSIQKAVTRSFYLRMLVGDFDPPSLVPYQSINKLSLDTESSRKTNLRTAQESIVLLKNLKGNLPIGKDKIKKLVVLGPNADDSKVLLSNYQGMPSRTVTILQGIQEHVKDSAVQIQYAAAGCKSVLCNSTNYFYLAEYLAKEADYVVMVMGTKDGVTEGEGFDRYQTTCDHSYVPLLGLPGCQKEFVKCIADINPYVILVLLNGGPLSIPDLYRDPGVVGIVEAFYPGALGGIAVADVLFGAFNPSGKMPVSVYESEDDLPPSVDYNMRPVHGFPGRTYRYSTREPLIPFGFGLSYADFKYLDLTLSKTKITACDSLEALVSLKNLSPDVAGDEIVQLYLVPVKTEIPTTLAPKINLVGFKRISLLPGDLQSLSITINPYLMSVADGNGVHTIYPGTYRVQVGIKDSGSLSTTFTISSERGDAVITSTCRNSRLCLACGS